jgi:hypothetical protein
MALIPHIDDKAGRAAMQKKPVVKTEQPVIAERGMKELREIGKRFGVKFKVGTSIESATKILREKGLI